MIILLDKFTNVAYGLRRATYVNAGP